MKRFAIFLGGLLVLPAFGEVAPVYYDDTVEYSDMFGDESEYEFYDDDVATESKDSAAPAAKQPTVKISRQPTTSRNIANRTTASRGTPTGASSANTSARGNSTGNSSRAVAARTTTNTSRSVATRGNSGRTVTSRTASSTSTTGATRSITDAVASSRAAATRATGGASQASATRTGTAATTKTTTARTATTGATATATNRAATSRAARTQATTKITTLGNVDENPLYNPNGVRTSIRSSTVMNNRVPTIRMASMSGTTSTSEVSVTATDTAQMDELAELTDYCKAQYMACMDNYCNVLDDNQGRCSCSANLKNYAKTEEALKKATEELQEVAQKIQYIGLTAREVESLFTQTEAELQMEKTSDNSQLKTSLDKIKDMIIDAKSNPSSYSSTTSSGLSFDLSGLLDFTIDSTGFDINSFLGGFLSNGSDVKNQRGAELYKTATSRCKANVLKSCTAQGVDASLITNAYDLEIDRECLAYERDLNDSNDRMTATVRNAKSVLQKARLLVAQAKNEYDMLGCINALDSCMQDEYVCGSDYENCLDPSGRYIVNGEIVIGTDPGRAVNGIQDGTTGVLSGDICSMNLYNVWNYDDPGVTQNNPADKQSCKNAWNSYSLEQNNGNLKDYIEQTIFENATKAKAGSSSIGMSEFLQNKIGWVDSSAKDGTRNYGMCISILNKCQDYTYTGTGNKTTYNFKNEVIKQYLYRAMVQIKAKQDQILSDYAESCVTDVNTCLSQNNYPTSREDGDWSDVQANIAVNACRSTIVTCMSVNGYSVNDPTPEDLYCWILGLKFNDNSCSRDPTPTPSGDLYTVSYSCASHGSGTIQSDTQTYEGETIYLPSSGCTADSGWTWHDWNCGGTHFDKGASYTPSRTLTCTASYESDNALTVTLNHNGGGLTLAGQSRDKLYIEKNASTGKWYINYALSSEANLSSATVTHKPGYTLRGYFTDNKVDVATDQSGDATNIAMQGTNDKTLNPDVAKNKSAGFTIRAAWAKNCEDSYWCELTIGQDGAVTYSKKHEDACTDWGTTEGTAALKCNDATVTHWTLYTLADNASDCGGTISPAGAPSSFCYQSVENSSCSRGLYNKVNNRCSDASCSSQLPSLEHRPVCSNNNKEFGGYFINLGSTNEHMVINSNGSYVRAGDVDEPDQESVQLKAKWNDRAPSNNVTLTIICDQNCSSCSSQTQSYSVNTNVNLNSLYSGANAWTCKKTEDDSNVLVNNSYIFTITENTTCTATCSGGDDMNKQLVVTISDVSEDDMIVNGDQ